MKVVVSGAIGVGKSTVVREVMRHLGWSAPGGFFTHWGGGKRGSDALYLSTWAGETHLMARRWVKPTGPEQVPYELDSTNFQRIVTQSLSMLDRPVVIDELGMIELNSAEFLEEVVKLFQASVPVLVVIQERALDRWMSRLGPGGGIPTYHVTSSTRAVLPEQIAARFQQRLPS